MEKQEIYNKVKAGMLGQMKRCTRNDALSCVYSNGSLRCAGGFLLEGAALDSKGEWPASPELRGRLLNVNRDTLELIRQADLIGHHGFVSILQRIHDFANIDDWEDRLAEAAKKEGLEP